MNSQSTVVFTTTAEEFNGLLNRSNWFDKHKAEIEVLRSENLVLKQHLMLIGSKVYENDGKCNIWSSASETTEVNEALKYAKALSGELK